MKLLILVFCATCIMAWSPNGVLVRLLKENGNGDPYNHPIEYALILWIKYFDGSELCPPEGLPEGLTVLCAIDFATETVSDWIVFVNRIQVVATCSYKDLQFQEWTDQNSVENKKTRDNLACIVVKDFFNKNIKIQSQYHELKNLQTAPVKEVVVESALFTINNPDTPTEKGKDIAMVALFLQTSLTVG